MRKTRLARDDGNWTAVQGIAAVVGTIVGIVSLYAVFGAALDWPPFDDDPPPPSPSPSISSLSPTSSATPPPSPSVSPSPTRTTQGSQNTVQISAPSSGGTVNCRHAIEGSGEPPSGKELRLVIRSQADGKFFAGPRQGNGMVVDTAGIGSWYADGVVFGGPGMVGAKYTVYVVIVSASKAADMDTQTASNAATGYNLSDTLPNGAYDVRDEISVTRSAVDNC